MSELVFVRLGETPVPYHEGWDLQKRVHADRVGGLIPDTVLVLEHEPVYTAGKRTGRWDRPLTDPGAPVVDIDRGGKLTWHGPGQATVYPIVRLGQPIDVVGYVRMLEEALIRAVADFGLEGKRVEGRTGVWLDADPDRGRAERKIAAIGCRIARGVGMHGFALNCDNDPSWFERIVPCGITDAGVTSLSAELGRDVTVAEAVPVVERHLAAVLGATGYRVQDSAPEPARGAEPEPAGA
ncbi:lipoyl(octanoyl) transferase LipB [Streptomonospora wellingtoniae]|uniref:Octanoyltransferase n=1 Tax=Streptomonospora wellingtoniae TaxID=3075544 RepID=A0ABU2KP16_9ACTN|nr:lipoyl(octanoyl) transferase LipB [Streptomonospora sp. DSM 45055]MDT0301021.1 lipoyl(octanoyl) transferase LipB [Streptomonospora sp. DSM 45055]